METNRVVQMRTPHTYKMNHFHFNGILYYILINIPVALSILVHLAKPLNRLELLFVRIIGGFSENATKSMSS